MSTDRRAGVIGNAAIKVPCRVCATANLTLDGEQTIDGVAAVTGDRVLVTAQTSSIDNGIYVCDTGAWTRATDFDAIYDVVFGTLIKVNSGTSNSGFWYVSTTTANMTPGTDAINFGMASSTLAVVSAFMQTMLDDATAAAAMTTLGITANGQSLITAANYAAMRTALGVPATGAITASGLTQTTARMLGRTTASTGGVEELTAGDGLSLAATNLAVAFATQAEMETGTSLVKVVSPGVQHNHPGMAKAWVTFNGTGTPAVIAGYNVASITDNGTGDYTVNFTTAFSSANYCVVGTCSRGATDNNAIFQQHYATAPAAGSCRVSTTVNGGIPTDMALVFVAFYGDQ